MTTSPYPPGCRRQAPAGKLASAVAGCLLLICSSAVASTVGESAPVDISTVPVSPRVVQPLLRSEDLGELERQQRLRELRRQLVEHSRSRRADAALRRSAAMPEPDDTPAVIADKILPLAPLPTAEGSQSAGAAGKPALPLAPGAIGRLPQALPDAVPEALAAPAGPVEAPLLPAALPQGAEAVQAAATPTKAGKVTNAAGAGLPDQRLTELERLQLRQQLRQVLRNQDLRNLIPAGSR
jgi:hypothetical protein